jgi:hypothetical protein
VRTCCINGVAFGNLWQNTIMVDATPVANFGEAAYAGTTFTFALKIPFVTEGAHTIWARRRGDTSGWAHREVFLWRPSVILSRADGEGSPNGSPVAF